MRAPLIMLVLLAACKALVPQGAVDTQEYVFVLHDGRSFMRVLPADWVPRYQGEWMRIDARHRVAGQDVVLVHPHFPIDPHGLEMVRVLRHGPTRGAASHYLWLPPGHGLTVGDPARTDLEHVGPHTWIRPSAFRIAFQRPSGPAR